MPETSGRPSVYFISAVLAFVGPIASAIGRHGSPGRRAYCSDGNSDNNRVASDILTALEAGGFAVVPKVPSDEMVVRGDEVLIEELNKLTFAGNDTPAQKVWIAMLAASNPKEEGK